MVDLGTRYPLVSDWMVGAKEDHPYAKIFADPLAEDWGQWTTLDEFEAILSTLYAANPVRLDGKRRDFRALRSGDELRGMRTELLFGAYLARHSVQFEFGRGGTPQPDLILTSLDLGVELTARSANVEWALKKHLAYTVSRAHRDVHLRLTFSAKPFAIRTRVRNEITEEVFRAIQDGESSVHSVIRPPKDGQPAITLQIEIQNRGPIGFWPTVKIAESGTLLTPMMSDIEDALVDAMEEKRKKKQGSALPTILVVDVAAIEGSWLRSTRAWGDRLVALIQPSHSFVGLAIMVSSGWQPSFRFVLGENSTVPPEAVIALKQFEVALGMRQLGVTTVEGR